MKIQGKVENYKPRKEDPKKPTVPTPLSQPYTLQTLEKTH